MVKCGCWCCCYMRVQFTWMMYFVTLFGTICTSPKKNEERKIWIIWIAHSRITSVFFTFFACAFHRAFFAFSFCSSAFVYEVYASRLVVRFSIASLSTCTHNYLYCLMSKHRAAETCVVAVLAHTHTQLMYIYHFIRTAWNTLILGDPLLLLLFQSPTFIFNFVPVFLCEKECECVSLCVHEIIWDFPRCARLHLCIRV